MAAKSKGLGKGLASLLGDVEEFNSITENTKITEEDLKQEQSVKIRLVEPNRNQPRREFDEEALNELAESIKIHGIITPLIVVKKGEHYQIIAGERRWRAAKIAGLSEVPVIIKNYNEREIAEIALIENIQRKNLNPIDEAAAYKKLIDDYDMTQEELAERISKSRTSITNALRLLRLPEEIQNRLISGTVSPGHCKVLLGVEDSVKQLELAKEIEEKNLSVRETEERVQKLSAERKEKPVLLQNEAEYKESEAKLKALLGTKVTIKRKAQDKGTIQIEFYSLEDFERIQELIEKGIANGMDWDCK